MCCGTMAAKCQNLRFVGWSKRPVKRAEIPSPSPCSRMRCPTCRWCVSRGGSGWTRWTLQGWVASITSDHNSHISWNHRCCTPSSRRSLDSELRWYRWWCKYHVTHCVIGPSSSYSVLAHCKNTIPAWGSHPSGWICCTWIGRLGGRWPCWCPACRLGNVALCETGPARFLRTSVWNSATPLPTLPALPAFGSSTCACLAARPSSGDGHAIGGGTSTQR